MTSANFRPVKFCWYSTFCSLGRVKQHPVFECLPSIPSALTTSCLRKNRASGAGVLASKHIFTQPPQAAQGIPWRKRELHVSVHALQRGTTPQTRLWLSLGRGAQIGTQPAISFHGSTIFRQACRECGQLRCKGSSPYSYFSFNPSSTARAFRETLRCLPAHPHLAHSSSSLPWRRRRLSADPGRSAYRMPACPTRR